MSRPLAFTRAMRLVHRNDFARVFREGRRARGSIVLVVVRENGLEGSRLGLSVGRVIWKSAVKRNRVRRIFREAFRLSYPELPRGVDVIMVPAAPKLAPELAPTRAELVALVARALARRDDARRERRSGTSGARNANHSGGSRAETRTPVTRAQSENGPTAARSCDETRATTTPANDENRPTVARPPDEDRATIADAEHRKRSLS
jgi:ribonuclease P protein component